LAHRNTNDFSFSVGNPDGNSRYAIGRPVKTLLGASTRRRGRTQSTNSWPPRSWALRKATRWSYRPTRWTCASRVFGGSPVDPAIFRGRGPLSAAPQ